MNPSGESNMENILAKGLSTLPSVSCQLISDAGSSGDGMLTSVYEFREGTDETETTVPDETSSLSLVSIGSSTKAAPHHASDPTLQPYKTGLRSKIERLLGTQRFQVLIVLLVILDCIVVISELLLDLRLLSLEAHNEGRLNMEPYRLVPDILHAISITLLSLFLLEMLVKLLAFGLAILSKKGELFDMVVTALTFILEIVYQHEHSALNGFGLIIILRLWRVSKILEGIVKSVKVRADRSLECERRRREDIEEELARVRQLCHAQELYIAQLKKLLNEQNSSVPEE